MTKLRIGDWCVDSNSGEISRDGETVRIDARAMRLLLCLAEHAGEVVSIDELLNQVWAGVTVSSDSVYQAVASLRRQLGDDPRQPVYIATAPRLGYRMVATISPWSKPAVDEPASDASGAATQTRTATFDAPVAGRRRRIGFTGGVFTGAGVLRIVAVAEDGW